MSASANSASVVDFGNVDPAFVEAVNVGGTANVLRACGAPGHGSSAYGHDYALQVMLMQDELEMAGRGLALLANITHDAGQKYSAYNFFEQFAVPKSPNQATVGCGELNLVNVMAPIKVAR